MFKETVLLGLVSLLFAILLVGDPAARLASANVDDHPVIFANYLKNPAHYANDQLSVYAPPMTYASIQSLSVWFLSKYGHVDPNITAYGLVLLQSVLMVLAIWALVSALGVSSFLRVLIPLVIYSSNCWANNLAWFPIFLKIPYPGQFVIPIILFAFANLMKNRWKTSLVLFLLASLIHPSYGFYSLVICSFYLLASWKDLKLSDLFTRHLCLAAIMMVSMLLGLNALDSIPKADLMTVREAVPSLLSNPHLRPWTHSDFWSWSLPTFACAMFCSGWVVATQNLATPATRLYWCSVAVSLFFGVAHLFGVYFEVPLLMQAIPLRVTFLTSLIFTIYVVKYCGECMEKNEFLKSFAGAGVLGFIAFQQHGFPLFLALLLIGLTIKLFWVRACVVTYAGLAILIYPLTGRPIRLIGLEYLMPTVRSVFIPGWGADNRQFVVMIVLAVLLAVLFTKSKNLEKGRLMGRSVSLLVVCSLVLFRCYVSGKETFSGVSASLLDAQLWAKTHTEASAIFIVGGRSWRGIAERRAVFADRPPFGPEAVIRTRKTFEFGKAIQAFYHSVGKSDYTDLNENDIRLFQKTFGGDFFVRNRSNSNLAFKVAYQNQHFIIYELSL